MPTEEEIASFDLPSIANVTGKSRERRCVRLHFFNDDEEFFASAYDPDRKEFFGYRMHFGTDYRPIGSWERVPLESLLTETSRNGAHFTCNSNFTTCKAMEVPKIQKSEEIWEFYRKRNEKL